MDGALSGQALAAWIEGQVGSLQSQLEFTMLIAMENKESM